MIGVSGSLIAAFLLAYAAVSQNILGNTLPVLAYSVGLIATFVFSAAYNMTLEAKKRAILRKFDRAAIFVMIAGTYTPLGLIGIGGTWGTSLVIANWSLALIGVISTVFFAKKFERASLALYLFQGGLVLVALEPMARNLSLFAFAMILLGAFTYAAGVVFYRRDDWKFNRAVWHVFVLIAAAIHYAAIVDIVKFT